MNPLLTLYQLFILPNSALVYIMLFESRLSRRATRISIIVLIILLIIVNMGGVHVLGVPRMSQLIPFTCALPSLAFFLAISRHQGMRFLYTFCVADVLCLWIVDLTSLFQLWQGASSGCAVSAPTGNSF